MDTVARAIPRAEWDPRSDQDAAISGPANAEVSTRAGHAHGHTLRRCAEADKRRHRGVLHRHVVRGLQAPQPAVPQCAVARLLDSSSRRGARSQGRHRMAPSHTSPRFTPAVHQGDTASLRESTAGEPSRLDPQSEEALASERATCEAPADHDPRAKRRLARSAAESHPASPPRHSRLGLILAPDLSLLSGSDPIAPRSVTFCYRTTHNVRMSCVPGRRGSLPWRCPPAG